MAESGGRPSPDGGHEKERGNVPSGQKATDSGTPETDNEVENIQSLTQSAPSGEDGTPGNRHTQPNKNRNLNTADKCTRERSKTDESKTISRHTERDQNPAKATGGSQRFVQDTKSMFKRQSEETMSKGDKDVQTKTQGRTRKQEMHSMQDGLLNKPDEHDDSQKKPATITENPENMNMNTELMSEPFVFIDHSDADSNEAGVKSREENKSNAVAKADTEEVDTEEHNADTSDSGNDREANDSNEAGVKSREENKSNAVTKADTEEVDTEEHNADISDSGNDREANGDKVNVFKNDFQETDTESDKKEKINNQAEEKKIGVSSNLLDENALKNDSSPAESSSSSSIEKISDDETDCLDESHNLEYQMSIITHLPVAVESKRNTSAMATSLNRHKEKTDNAVEISAAGESVKCAFQGEEQSDSDSIKIKTTHSKVPDKSSESVTSCEHEYSQTETDLGNGLAKNHLSSEPPGTGNEKEKQMQCLNKTLTDEKGQKVIATTPQVQCLLSCPETQKNTRVDSQTCEEVEPPDKGPVERSTENDLSTIFKDKCSINEPDPQQKPVVPTSSCEPNGKSEYKSVTKAPVPAPRVALQGLENGKDVNSGHVQATHTCSPKTHLAQEEPNSVNKVENKYEGGTEESVEMLPEETMVPHEDTPNRDPDCNIHKHLQEPDPQQKPVVPTSSCEPNGKSEYKSVTKAPVPAPRVALQGQDKKEGSKRRLPPSPRQKGTKSNLDTNLERQERGGTEDLVQMLPEETDVSNKDTAKPDPDGNTNKNVPGLENGKDVNSGHVQATPTCSPKTHLAQEEPYSVNKVENKYEGGTEESVEMLPEETMVPHEDTANREPDCNIHKHLQGSEREKNENTGHVPTAPTPLPRTWPKREQLTTVSNKENEIKDTKSCTSIHVRVYEDCSKCRLYTVVFKDTDEYLKWKYLIHNESASKKIKDPQLRFQDGTIAIHLGNKLPDKEVDDGIKTCLSGIIKTVEGLFMACFDASDEVDTIFRDLQMSKMVEKQGLCVHKISQKIYFVCSDSDIELVEHEFKQALEKSKAHYRWHFQIDLCCEPEVAVLFDASDVKKENEFTVDFCKRPCKCTFKGQKLVKLAEAKHELQETFKKFTHNSVSFTDIKNIDLIQTVSVPDFLNTELRELKPDTKGIIFKVCDTEKKVLIAGPVQPDIDTFVNKIKKINISRKEFEADDSVKTDLLKYESEYKGRLFIEWSNDKCVCIGNQKLITIIESAFQKPEGEVGESINNKPHDYPKTRCVEIEKLDTFDFIRKFTKRVINQQRYNVTVDARCSNDKFGFLIKGSVDQDIEDCENHIRSVESRVKDKEMSISHPAGYNELARGLEEKNMVLLKEIVPCNSRKTKCWTFVDKGHALKLSCAAAKSCWKNLYVDMKMSEEGFSQKSGFYGDRIWAEMFIQDYQSSDEKRSHDFCDTVTSLLLTAEKMGCKHTCIPMDKTFGWPVRKFDKPIISASIDYLKQSAGELQKEVELCVEDGGEFDKLYERISKALSDKEVAYGAGNTVYCIDVKIIGFEDAIHNAELDLIQHSLPCKTQGKEAELDKTTIKTCEAATFEKEFTENLITSKPGQAQKPVVKENILTQMKSLVGYVKILHVPTSYTFKDLSAKLLTAKLPVSVKQLIYLSGMPEAVLVCSSSQDALELSEYKGVPPFAFQYMEKQVLGNFSMKIQRGCLDKLRNQGKFKKQMFLDHLTEINVRINEKDDTIVNAETTYQMKCFHDLVKQLLDSKTESCGASKATSEDNEYEHLSFNTRIIENVTDHVWQIMQIERESKIDEFQKSGGTVKHEGHTLKLSYGCQGTDTGMFNDYFDVFNTFIKGMEFMEIGEIPVDERHFPNIPIWQSEIDKTFETKCSTFFPKERKLIAYCDSYENLKRVEHHFLVKQGMKKQTGRRRKAIAVDECGPASREPEHETYRAGRKTDFQWRRDARNVKSFKTNEQIQVYVYEADILNLDVDCIVNAANESLSHGGGVAQVIASKAGQQLTKEGDLYIKKHGCIPVGNAVSTTAGNLRYERVIHAVGPRWSHYSRTDEGVGKCEEDLFNAIFNSCKEAKEMNFQSIAFPAISSAIFGVPEDLCVCQYVKATVEFSKMNKGSLKEIHFIDKNPAIVRKIQIEFTTVLNQGNKTPYTRQAHVIQSRNGRLNAFGHTSSNVVKNNTYTYHKQDQTQCSHYQERLRKIYFANSTKFAEKDAIIYKLGEEKNHNLHICKGDLLQVDSAAIVVTLNENKRGGALARGVDIEMTKAHMFDVYMKEVQSQLPGKAEVGQIAITKGYGTQFSHVIHVVHPLSERNKNQADRRKCLFEIYKSIFQAAMEKVDIEIVATALIGIDNKTDEVDFGCNVFLDGYLWYLEKLKSERKSGPKVHLVCRDEKHFQRICTTFDYFVEESLASHTEGLHSSVKEVTPEPEKYDECCVICMDEMTVPKTLKCGHSFCTDCIDKYFVIKKTCPTCGAICGVITGDQPDGRMDVYTNKWSHCAGYPDVGQIVITYSFASGKQGENHPRPGVWYEGITRRAYLPDNKEGQKIRKMLEIAFKRKLVFTIGRSRTTGKEGVITWNDIHHKTDPKPHSQFGYPDETYLSRVKDELAAKGVTEDDIK